MDTQLGRVQTLSTGEEAGTHPPCLAFFFSLVLNYYTICVFILMFIYFLYCLSFLLERFQGHEDFSVESSVPKTVSVQHIVSAQYVFVE